MLVLLKKQPNNPCRTNIGPSRLWLPWQGWAISQRGERETRSRQSARIQFEPYEQTTQMHEQFPSDSHHHCKFWHLTLDGDITGCGWCDIRQGHEVTRLRWEETKIKALPQKKKGRQQVTSYDEKTHWSVSLHCGQTGFSHRQPPLVTTTAALFACKQNGLGSWAYHYSSVGLLPFCFVALAKRNLLSYFGSFFKMRDSIFVV